MNKITGYFCLAVGILNLGMWTAIISTGQVPNLSQQLVSYLFHWSSELSTAVLLITAGLFLLRISKHRTAHNLYYLSSGFLINAINGAFWYYLLNFNLPIFLMSGAILSFTLFLSFKNFRYREDIALLAVGTVIYGSINFLGYGFDRGDTSLLIYTFPMLLTVIGLLVLKTGKPAQRN